MKKTSLYTLSEQIYWDFFLSFRSKKAEIQEPSSLDGQSDDAMSDDHLELTKQELDLAKQNFEFYIRNKGTQVDLFELPMLLQACGMNISAGQLNLL